MKEWRRIDNDGLCIADLEKTGSANVGVTRSFVILGC